MLGKVRETGSHSLMFTFDDGALPLTLTVIDSNAVEDKLYGDINLDGKISVEDAAMLQRASVGFVRLTDLQNELADVNGDGRVSVLDVTCIQKYIAQFANGKGRTGDKY